MTGWSAVLLPAVSAGLAAAFAFPPRPRAHPRPPPRPILASSAGIGPVDARSAAATACGVGVWFLLGGWLGASLGVLAAVVAWRVVAGLEQPSARRRRLRLANDLPHAVDLIASSLAAGAAPEAAVAVVATAVTGPLQEELQRISSRLDLGVDPVTVWRTVAAHPQLGPLGRSLVRAVESGASVSQAMHRLSEDLRRSARADVEIRARSVGAKAAAPLGLCLLPAFILIGVVPMVAASVTVLFGS